MPSLRSPLISRRAVLSAAATTGAGLGAAGLVGCGGGRGGSEGSGGSSLKLAERKDTTRKAVRGGTYGSFTTQDITSMDGLARSDSQSLLVGAYVYSRLFKWKPGIVKASTGEVEGDLVESWEFSPDFLQLTMKIRPSAKGDPRPPLNSRSMAAKDVKFSFDKFLAKSNVAGDLFNSKNPAAPITDVTAVDANTVVLKLAFPFAALLDGLGSTYFRIQPTEADGKFNPNSEAFGSGPWMLQSYRPSAEIKLVRNPNWYTRDRPLLDGISIPIVPEYATQLAQFKKGAIWSGVVGQQDILATKRDLPELNLFQGDFPTGSPHIYFGWNGPFKDLRLRQAVSLLLDRQLYADTFSSGQDLRAAGLPNDVALNSHLGVGWGPYWLNPQAKDFGDGAKYFKRDVAEAKKLIAAAGFPNGLDSNFYTLQQVVPAYGVDWQNQMQVLIDFCSEGGLRLKLNLDDYSTVYIPKYHYSKGAFDGLSASPGGARTDPLTFLQTFYHSSGSATRIPAGADSQVDTLLSAAAKEMDLDKRVKLVHDLQMRLVANMDAVPYSFQATGFGLVWPFVGNYGAYRIWTVGSSPTEAMPFYWYDSANKKS